MLWQKLRQRFRKDGWLMLALAGSVIGCLLLGLSGSTSTTETARESRISQVLSAMEGAGQVEVAVFYQTTGDAKDGQQPTGAVVVADGAGDIGVRLRLIRAVSTLTGLQDNQVEVFKRKGQ